MLNKVIRDLYFRDGTIVYPKNNNKLTEIHYYKKDIRINIYDLKSCENIIAIHIKSDTNLFGYLDYELSYNLSLENGEYEIEISKIINKLKSLFVLNLKYNTRNDFKNYLKTQMEYLDLDNKIIFLDIVAEEFKTEMKKLSLSPINISKCSICGDDVNPCEVCSLIKCACCYVCEKCEK